MKLNTVISSVAMGATLLTAMAHPAQAWNQTVGSQVSDCTITGTASGLPIFTVDTNVYSYVNSSHQTVFTYRYDLTNDFDFAGLTQFAVNANAPVLDYFVGFGPTNGTALHDSNIGANGTTVDAGQDSADVHPYTWSAVSSGSTVTFSDVSTTKYAPTSIGVGDTLNKEFSPGNYGGEYFFVQSLTQLTNTTLTVTDGAGNTGQIAGCDGDKSVCGPISISGPLNPKGVPGAVPEPGTIASFLFGGLGLLGLTLRARRRSA